MPFVTAVPLVPLPAAKLTTLTVLVPEAGLPLVGVRLIPWIATPAAALLLLVTLTLWALLDTLLEKP